MQITDKTILPEHCSKRQMCLLCVSMIGIHLN